jgi:cell division protein FtsB
VKWWIAFLVLLFFVLQYRLWVGDGSLAEVQRLRESLTVQEAENAQLRERNAGLEAEVRDLKQGLHAVEERARSELGMVKEGETFFQIIPKE